VYVVRFLADVDILSEVPYPDHLCGPSKLVSNYIRFLLLQVKRPKQEAFINLIPVLFYRSLYTDDVKFRYNCTSKFLFGNDIPDFSWGVDKYSCSQKKSQPFLN
jgi:hypothetical protein